MEAFESLVAVAPEAEGFVVSGGVKFRVKLSTRKVAYTEEQPTATRSISLAPALTALCWRA